MDNVRHTADELIAQIDRRIQSVSLQDAVAILEELQGDIEARLDGLNDDIAHSTEDN